MNLHFACRWCYLIFWEPNYVYQMSAIPYDAIKSKYPRINVLKVKVLVFNKENRVKDCTLYTNGGKWEKKFETWRELLTEKGKMDSEILKCINMRRKVVDCMNLAAQNE